MKNNSYLYVNGYKNYQISTDGEVFSKYGKKILKPRKNRGGYLYVDLCENGNKKSHLIHRLVAETYINNPYKKDCINHIDGNKTNNCINNLEWCTHSENTLHAYKIGKMRADGKYNGRWKGDL